jgi:hypothetical protein
MALEWIVDLPYGMVMEGDPVYTLVREKRSGELFRTYHAYIARRGKQKWEVFFPMRLKQNDKTFRTLKAAKAYAVAIASLED